MAELREQFTWEQALTLPRSHRGASLRDLSRQSTVMVVFLRHAGCTFCREALSDLAEQRLDLQRQGVRIAVVHMSPPLQATQLFARYGLDDVHRFSDVDCKLYRAFGLRRGRVGQLASWRVLLRGLFVAFFQGHGIGGLQGDGLQMPGVFLLRDDRIVGSYQHASAADRPDYRQLAGILGAGDGPACQVNRDVLPAAGAR
ncbi:MAG: redoxin domain-containing protein [Pirellulaceae bacterium]|nr:redoxin domain-containing protein [Pirellulaceae bacterium]